jgi:hypothetical protein
MLGDNQRSLPMSDIDVLFRASLLCDQSSMITVIAKNSKLYRC